MSQPAFVNLGSLNIDLVFRVTDFAKPGETITALSTERHPGGKGLNQSVALARAGSIVHHVGCVGDDGAWLRDFLKAEGVNVSGIQNTPHMTGVASIQVRDGGENSIVLSPGANHAVDPKRCEALFQELSGPFWFLCQNETNGIAEAMTAAKAAGWVVCVNPAPMNDSARKLPYDLADWVILNETEAFGLLAEDRPDSVLAKWRLRFPSTGLVLTLGAEGAVGLLGGEVHHQPAFPANVVDTTAAGDTFVGFLLQALAVGQSLPHALVQGARAAALSVERQGAAPSIPFSGEWMTV